MNTRLCDSKGICGSIFRKYLYIGLCPLNFLPSLLCVLSYWKYFHTSVSHLIFFFFFNFILRYLCFYSKSNTVFSQNTFYYFKNNVPRYLLTSSFLCNSTFDSLFWYLKISKLSVCLWATCSVRYRSTSEINKYLSAHHLNF